MSKTSDIAGVLTASAVREAALKLGADEVGLAPAGPVAPRDHFLAWLRAGYAGRMDYLERHQDLRLDPRQLLPGARTVIVVALNYWPGQDAREQSRGPLKVAKYAWGEDYHRVLRRLLRRLRRELRRTVPDLKSRICVDTAPFADKYWAALAGVGWQGKHTNLVSRRYGSWQLLGSLVVDVPVDVYDAPHEDFCGTCTACLEACPTKAFPQPYVLDATRCISYWTIETQDTEIPADLREHFEGWVFGCDVCLDVCPWNRFEQPRVHPDLARRPATERLERGEVAATAEEFAVAFKGSPLARPGLSGLKRNVCVASETVCEIGVPDD